MMHFVRSTIAVTAMSAAFVAGVAAQDRSTPFRGETTVNVVEVPVEVYDTKTGEPVVGLTAEDFEILEDHTVQTISNFAELWRSEEDAVELSAAEREAFRRASEGVRKVFLEIGGTRSKEVLDRLLSATSE